jgi:hypothetical protein
MRTVFKHLLYNSQLLEEDPLPHFAICAEGINRCMGLFDLEFPEITKCCSYDVFDYGPHSAELQGLLVAESFDYVVVGTTGATAATGATGVANSTDALTNSQGYVLEAVQRIAARRLEQEVGRMPRCVCITPIAEDMLWERIVDESLTRKARIIDAALASVKTNRRAKKLPGADANLHDQTTLEMVSRRRMDADATFDWESSIAAANYRPIIIALQQGLALHKGEVYTQDQLAEMEHMRWNAFHFARGWRTMSMAEFEQRYRLECESIQRRAQESGWSTTRLNKELDEASKVRKDSSGRRHICLVSMAELAHVQVEYNRITGKERDFFQADRDVIEDVSILNSLNPDILRLK